MLNDGNPVSPEKFTQTREDLLQQFGGLTLSPSTVRGIWVHEGVRYEDESFRYVIDVDDTSENREFFAEFKLMLRERFEQIEVYIVSYPIDVV
jgi:hypothetical protein